MLKEEILDWIKSQPNGSKFTSANVYASVDSAEDPAKVSDVLRGLAKSNILNRHEFMEGNKKRFAYWLKGKPENNTIIIDNHGKIKSPRALTDLGAAETKQIEIPNNFTLELKTPNGFVITIKSSDTK